MALPCCTFYIHFGRLKLTSTLKWVIWVEKMAWDSNPPSQVNVSTDDDELQLYIFFAGEPRVSTGKEHLPVE